VRGTACRLPRSENWIERTAPWREAFSAGPPKVYEVLLYDRDVADAGATVAVE